MTLLGVCFAATGVALVAGSRWISSLNLYQWNWLHGIPLSEIGGSLFAIGVVGTVYDYYTRRDEEEHAVRRLRNTLRQEAPVMRDAVIRAFAFKPEDLERVATPALLDRLARNSLALRLGDAQFASELYDALLSQAIRTPERWQDVAVSIRLSSGRAGIVRGRSGIHLLEILVSWEYTVVPSHPVQRFACTSDLDEFHELVGDVPATSTWFLTPGRGIDASSIDSFELLSYSLDGVKRPIRRLTRASGQTYSVSLGNEAARARRPVRVRHTYRAVADPANHRLFLAIAQPARNVSIVVDYSAAHISRMSVTDLVGSSARPYVSQLPAQANGKELSIEVPGWVLAGTGFTFVWTLDHEETANLPASRPTSPGRAA